MQATYEIDRVTEGSSKLIIVACGNTAPKIGSQGDASLSDIGIPPQVLNNTCAVLEAILRVAIANQGSYFGAILDNSRSLLIICFIVCIYGLIPSWSAVAQMLAVTIGHGTVRHLDRDRCNGWFRLNLDGLKTLSRIAGKPIGGVLGTRRVGGVGSSKVSSLVTPRRKCLSLNTSSFLQRYH